MKNENINTNNICGQTEILINEYLEGMISVKDKEIMDAHISGCDECSKYFSETAALIKELNSLAANGKNLSVNEKNDLWSKVESNIDPDKYKKKNPQSGADNTRITFFSKYKYYISGVAAVILISLIFFALKNLSISDLQISQQSTFGLPTYWKVANLQGNPMIGNASMSAMDSIKEGQFIKTNDTSRAELVIANLGKILIEPNTKVIFVKGADGNNRILVEYGTIDANMNSKQKTFFVEMPSSVVSDMDGAYTLTIDSTGDGLVYVKSGRVEVQSDNNKGAIIPAGNLVITRKDLGVGTPFNENSSAQFKNALFNLDFGKCNGTCVTTLINSAKRTDAVTLVNLISTVGNEYKDAVYTKLANFVPPPTPVHSDSLPFFDEEKLNDWIDKIQAEVQMDVAKSMEDVEKNLQNMKVLEKIDPDSIVALKNFAKEWNFKIKTSQKGNYEGDEDSVYFDKEQFKKDMEEMQTNIKENTKINKQQLKEDMEQLREDLKDMKENLKENLNLNNEEIKREMENVKDEIERSKIEREKDRMEIYDQSDSTNKRRIKIKNKDDFEDPEEIETPEEPEAPETPNK